MTLPVASGYETPSSPELAAAMQAGLEARRLFTPAPTTPSPGPVLPPRLDPPSALEPVADVANHAASARPSPVAGVLRLLRRLAKGMVRPWLDLQALYNRTNVTVTEHLARAIHETGVSLRDEVQRIERNVAALSRRVNDSFHLAGHFHPEAGGRADGRVVEHVFVHTRLPSPPGRLLELGDGHGTLAAGTASRGFQVVTAPAAPSAPPGLLPFAPDSFDVVIALSALEAVGHGWFGPAEPGANDGRVADEVRRLLRPGGRFLLTLPFGERSDPADPRCHDRASLDAILRRFRVRELAFAVHGAGGWVFGESPPRSGAECTILALAVLEKE